MSDPGNARAAVPLDIGIEEATAVHADVMAAIHRAAFPPREAWSRDVMALQLELPNAFGFLSPAGGMILARVAADEAEILTLAVMPVARRCGLGAALLRAAMGRAALLGAATVFLEVSLANAAARPLYAAHGFREVGRRRRYYDDGSDALVLRASPLPPPPSAAG